jgi:putative thiamine transport system permease protein
MRAPAHKPTAALLALVFVPLLWSLGHAVLAGLDGTAWLAIWHDSQTVAALGQSLWTGAASTALATATAALLLSRSTTPAQLQRLARRQPFMLAVPHAAFAMGLVLLIAPAGWLLRLLSPWATGLQAPPPWPTTQDPWGLGLIAVLALKETPFLLWAAHTHLLRPDVAQRLQRELQLAASFGYGAQAAWWCIVWPQLLPRLAAPLLAVLAYGLTVVDVALVIGPASPPTLAVLAWQWLLDANAPENAKGAAAAWALAATVAVSAGLAWALLNAPLWRRLRTRGAPDPGADGSHAVLQTARAERFGAPAPMQSVRAWLSHATHVQSTASILSVVYIAVLAALLLDSFIGSWPFPELLPTRWSFAAWRTVWDSAPTLWTTLWLALLSAACALLWVVAWLEWAPPRWQQRLQALAYAPLLLPALLWVIGLHRLALSWGLDASGSGVWLAHTLACLPYVLLTSSGAYSGFDARYAQLAATLGQTRLVFLLRVKWPLLRAALASGFAVGFAVSVAQYLPTLYVGAGRFATVTTDAVTLAAGGQRSLMAAFAWLQWLLPVLVFAGAAWLGRNRRFARPVQALGTIAT